MQKAFNLKIQAHVPEMTSISLRYYWTTGSDSESETASSSTTSQRRDTDSEVISSTTSQRRDSAREISSFEAQPPQDWDATSVASFSTPTPLEEAEFNNLSAAGLLGFTTFTTASKSESSLMLVRHLQKPIGHWALADTSLLVKIPLSRLVATCPVKNENSWATALVLCLLEMKHLKEQDQWFLFANEAKKYISSCGEDVRNLMASAKRILSSRYC